MLRLILITTLYILTYHQSQCVTCTFIYEIFPFVTYRCQLNNQIIESETDLTEINGIHEAGFTDQHVTWISSQNSRILFFPYLLIQHFPNVRRVTFDESQMPFVQPIYCNELTRISLNGNLLMNIPDGAFANCTQLEELSLDGNNIESIDEHTFSALTNLQSLYLRRNNLSSIHPNAFRLLENLLAIDLGSNNLETLDRELFVSCWKLQHIVINNNKLTTLSDDFFTRNWQLRHLDLSHNQISTIGPKMFGTAFLSGTFNLSYNLIDELPVFDYVFSLRNLHLNNNKITKTLPNTFKNLSDLFILRLDENQIYDLQADTFGEYASVRYVYLNSNNISVLPANSFRRTMINELYLSDNQLDRLDAASFAGMSNLFVLHVERNRIESIDRQIFVEAPYLGTINMAGNICADGSFSRDYNLNWPKIGTCSSVKVQANVIALVIILLIKNVF